MSLKSGFFNSVNHDRKYSTEDFSRLVNAIVTDGIVPTKGEEFMTIVGDGLTVQVKSGFAWFNSTWSMSEDITVLNIDPADVSRPRFDAVVIDIDHTDPVRANTLKIIKGAPSASPVKPTLANGPEHFQHAIAYVSVPAGATSLTAANIDIRVGQDDCPFAMGKLESVSITDLFNAWDAEFQAWFDNLKTQLGDNVVTNLQNQIDGKVAIADKATPEDLAAGTPDKWVDAEGLKGSVEEAVGSIDTITIGNSKYTIKLGTQVYSDIAGPRITISHTWILSDSDYTIGVDWSVSGGVNVTVTVSFYKRHNDTYTGEWLEKVGSSTVAAGGYTDASAATKQFCIANRKYMLISVGMSSSMYIFGFTLDFENYTITYNSSTNTRDYAYFLNGTDNTFVDSTIILPRDGPLYYPCRRSQNTLQIIKYDGLFSVMYSNTITYTKSSYTLAQVSWILLNNKYVVFMLPFYNSAHIWVADFYVYNIASNVMSHSTDIPISTNPNSENGQRYIPYNYSEREKDVTVLVVTGTKSFILTNTNGAISSNRTFNNQHVGTAYAFSLGGFYSVSVPGSGALNQMLNAPPNYSTSNVTYTKTYKPAENDNGEFIWDFVYNSNSLLFVVGNSILRITGVQGIGNNRRITVSFYSPTPIGILPYFTRIS